MSNKISDTAIIRAAKKAGTLQIACVDFSYHCFEITIIANDEDQATTQVMYKEARAAQAELDAANDVTDEMLNAGWMAFTETAEYHDYTGGLKNEHACIEAIIKAALKEKSK